MASKLFRRLWILFGAGSRSIPVKYSAAGVRSTRSSAFCISSLNFVPVAETGVKSPELQVDNNSSNTTGSSLTGENGNSTNAEVVVEPMDELFEPFSSERDVHQCKEGTFQDLFRRSQFVQAHNPVGKEVEGVIIAVHQDKMYVDFGCKFHAVACPDEAKKGYCVGARVRVVVEDLEVTGHFIGDSKHNSLMEAQVKLGQLI